jgi:hypothetical protein
MSIEFNNLNDEEKLKAENDFLKMKIMLEHGAAFGSMQAGEPTLDPEIEHQFLKNIMLFEKQFAKDRKVILLYDKIGRPSQFKPVNEISDAEIDAAWEQLDEYLQSHQINLAALSPKVTARELYRFTVEELFEHEMDDMHLPGFTTNFTYDEFHPDFECENTNTAVNDCIKEILSKVPLQWMVNFKKENLQLNNYQSLAEDEFRAKVNQFKNAYDDMSPAEITAINCSLDDNQCSVNGNFCMTVILQQENIPLSGTWLVEFERDFDLGYWDIHNVQIESIKF